MAILPACMQIFISNLFIELRQPAETNIPNSITLKAKQEARVKLKAVGSWLAFVYRLQ